MNNPIRVCVGIGSNLDFPARQVRAAFGQLARLPRTRLEACSRLYRNPPMGPQDQPDYVNACAVLSSRLAPATLLAALQEIERDLGRVRVAQRWGPRRIDLDLLLYGERTIELAGLAVPHPGIAERAFVLLPLAEIAPRLRVPGHATVRALLARLDASDLVALPPA